MSKPRIALTSEKRVIPDYDYSSEAAEVSAILSTEPCVISDLIVTNATSTKGYVHLFDADEVPSTGAVPKLRLGLPATDTGTTTVGYVSVDNDRYFQKGCVVAISTTFATFTASANTAYFNANISE